jgi:hypothetical protein
MDGLVSAWQALREAGCLIGSSPAIHAKAGVLARPQPQVQIPVSFLKFGTGLFAALSPRARTFVQKQPLRVNSSQEG